MVKLESHLGDAVFATGMESQKFSTSKKWMDTTHFHADTEIHVILSGSAVIEIDREDVEVRAGDICLLAPQSSHYPKSYTDTLEKTNFYFSLKKNYNYGLGQNQFSEYFYYAKIFKSVKSFFIINDNQLVAIVKKLLSEELTPQNEHIFSAYMSLFYIILSARIKEHLLLVNSEPFYQSAESENLLKQIKIVEEFFQKRYNEEIGIRDLARELCLSESHTHRIVKKVFEEGFKKTLMKQRIEHACMLIKQKELPLTEIASLCGYTSYNGFLSAFKGYMGKTPKEYEKTIR